MKSSELKTEYVRMVNDHHREMLLLNKRNELAETYSEGVERRSLHMETAWFLLAVALVILCASLLFGGVV